MTGAVSWEFLTMLVGAVIVSGGIILSMVRWIYNDSNNTRTEIYRVSADLTDKLSRVREDIANKYVTAETHNLVTTTFEKAIDDLKAENRKAIENLADRIDHTLLAVAATLKTPEK